MKEPLFNPPPGWPPVPPGWRPPPGWKPDPSWPPAPVGWQFWSEPPSPNSSEQFPASAPGSSIPRGAIIGAALILVLAIAGGAFYIVQSLKPHEYDIMFELGGSNSDGVVQYGLGDNLKTREGVGSSGNWGFQEHEKFAGNGRHATLILNITSLIGDAECTIYQDGRVLDDKKVQGRGGTSQLTCSAIAGP